MSFIIYYNNNKNNVQGQDMANIVMNWKKILFKQALKIQSIKKESICLTAVG